jgi:DNA-binding protein H-NS
MRNSIDLKAMTFDDLIALKQAIQAHLSERAEKEKRELRAKLERLEEFVDGDPGSPAKDRSPLARRRKPEPRYRNPDNPSETWAGRGLTPRWMQSLLKQGMKREDFEINSSERNGFAANAGSRRQTPQRAIK